MPLAPRRQLATRPRLPAMRETWVRSLGQEDPLENEMATHSSILAWRIPWTEEPDGLQSTGSLTCTAGEGDGTPLQDSRLEKPWTEEPGGLQSMGSLRVRHD